MRVRLIVGLASLAAAFGIFFQWHSISELRSQNSALGAPADVMTPPTPSEPENMMAETAEERERLRRENQDLPRLRNQVRQLRSRAAELVQARGENERLMAARENRPGQPVTPVITPEGFIAREALADMGLDTPEATVQTFFRALRDGDVQRMSDVIGQPRLSPQQLELTGPEKSLEMKQQMQTFSNFKIVERKEISPDELEVSLQSSLGPSIIRLTLLRKGNQWLVDH